MFDTMTMTKVVGGFCGTLLIFMLGGWAAELVYSSEAGHGEDHAQGYVIEVPESGGEPAEAAPEVPFEEVYATASAADGEALWRNCRSCHALEQGQNGVGPYLYGVVGRAVDTASGYAYSGALEKVADVWTPENLYHFLEAPTTWAPGTKMSYNGMRDAQDRANLIAYLDSLDD